MIEIKAPGHFDPKENNKYFSVFLAGSIEMGGAEPWQEEIIRQFEEYPVTFLNPRRDDWDSSWVQSIYNEQFNTQVNWELRGLEESSTVIFYFDPETKSPITLMELGFVAGANFAISLTDPNWIPNAIVCCPEGFWRRGNIEIICDRHNIPLCSNKQELIYKLKKRYKLWASENVKSL